MLRIVLLFLIFFQGSHLFSSEYPPALTNFLRCLFLDSESGYVFFGTKPVCYYGVAHNHSILMGSSTHELEATLRLGIHWWQEAHPVQKNDELILKIRKFDDRFEILSLNKKEVLKTIEENLSLFRYVLGAKITPQSLFFNLATNDEPFYKILNDNNVLAGILLGFGTQNSILGSRTEHLSDLQSSLPKIPYKPFTPKTSDQAINDLTLSLLFKDNFKRKEGTVAKQTNFGFTTLEEELAFIENLEMPPSPLLATYAPRLVFQNYRLQEDHSRLIDNYEEQQKKILELIEADDFTDRVLKKLTIHFENPTPELAMSEPPPKLVAQEIRETIRKRLLDDLEAVCEGIQDAETGQADRYPNPDLNLVYELFVRSRIEEHRKTAEQYFTCLNQNESLKALNKHVYFKSLTGAPEGSPVLQKENSKAVFSYATYWPLQNEHVPMKAASHITLDLNQVISGLAEGVQGMKVGESREIHIHPDAGYGFLIDEQLSFPLKFVITLESIEDSSPPLHLQSDAQETIFPSSQDFYKIKQGFDYHLGKSFWNFYKTGLSFTSKELIAQLIHIWNEPSSAETDPLLDRATLAIYKKQHQQQKEKFAAAIKASTKTQPIVDNSLYRQWETQGIGSKLFPKRISLTYKDLDGHVLKAIQLTNLTKDGLARLPRGIKLGLADCSIGDKGTLWIDPDLTDMGLFRNALSHRALLVDFEVNESVQALENTNQE